MKIIEAINSIDSICPNSYTTAEKVRWLSVLDGIINKEIMATHEDAPEEEFTGYSEEDDMDEDLYMPFPYDEAYIHWLESRINYYNGEAAKYANSNSQFQAMYSSFFNWYNKKHMPNGTSINYF